MSRDFPPTFIYWLGSLIFLISILHKQLDKNRNAIGKEPRFTIGRNALRYACARNAVRTLGHACIFSPFLSKPVRGRVHASLHDRHSCRAPSSKRLLYIRFDRGLARSTVRELPLVSFGENRYELWYRWLVCTIRHPQKMLISGCLGGGTVRHLGLQTSFLCRIFLYALSVPPGLVPKQPKYENCYRLFITVPSNFNQNNLYSMTMNI